MKQSDSPQKVRWLAILLCVAVAALVWRFVDVRTTSIWILAAITAPGILVILGVLYLHASPSLEVEDGVIVAHRPFGKTIELPINQLVSVDKFEHGFAGERLVIRGLRGVEIVIDRKFDADEINEMLSAVRAARPDLSILTEGLWGIKPQDGR